MGRAKITIVGAGNVGATCAHWCAAAELGDNASEVEFFISYEFKSRMLGLLMGSVFDTAFRKFAEAFERRADAVFV